MRWLITNRNQDKNNNGFGGNFSSLTFWTFDPSTAKPGDKIANLSSWMKCTASEFRKSLADVAAKFPDPLTTPPESQKHVTLFIHGYDNNWLEAVNRYDTIATQLFDGPASLGELVSFDWPSKGSV
jgi:esterase/lipase superfamily enzyme